MHKYRLDFETVYLRIVFVHPPGTQFLPPKAFVGEEKGSMARGSEGANIGVTTWGGT